MKYFKECAYCHNDFIVREDKYETARYCSRKCVNYGVGTLNREYWHRQHKCWANEPREQYIDQMRISFERFFEKTESCWLWQGVKQNKMCYGGFTFRGKSWSAHRASYHIYKGLIPDGLLVLHKCDKPDCVNPEHLWLGTHLDNLRDKLHKNRGKGEKLNPDKVKEIKRLLDGGVKGSRICIDFGISNTTLCSIKSKKTWADIK